MVSRDLEASLPDELLDLDRFPTEEHPLIPGHVSRGMQPIGLGPRVPMIIVSPWTQGGWVCSQVFDHTSVLQFLETRFGVREPNISAWRRAVCGDLTAAFDFSNRPEPVSVQIPVPLPARTRRQPYRVPREQQMPQQESGVRRSRALPYTLMVDGNSDGDRFSIQFVNSGMAGAAFAVHDGTSQIRAPPLRYLRRRPPHRCMARCRRRAALRPDSVWSPRLSAPISRRACKRSTGSTSQLRRGIDDRAAHFDKLRHEPVTAVVEERYSGTRQSCTISPGERREIPLLLENSSGWYDLAITSTDQNYLRRFAGHVETGRPGTSDPAVYTDV